MGVDGDSNFARVFDRGLAVVIGLVSGSFLLGILSLPGRVFVSLIILLSLSMWIMADGIIRRWINATIVMKENQRWRGVVLKVLDFLMMLGIFIVVRLFLSGVEGGVENSELSAAEGVTFTLVGISGAIAFIDNVYALKGTF